MENSFDLKTDRYWQIVKRRWLAALTTFVTVSTLGIITTANKTDLYEAEAKLQFQQINPISSIPENSEELEYLPTVAEKNNYLDTEAEVIRSTPVVRQTLDELLLKGSEDKPLKVKDFRSKLNVTEITSTDILKITYQHFNPQLAKEAVNTLVDNYIENNIATNKVEAQETKTYLEEQIVNARKKLLKAEEAISQLKSNKQILSSDREVSKIVSSLENIENRLIDAKSKLNNISSQSRYIKEQLNMDAQQAFNAISVSQSSMVQQIVARLEELELQLDREQKRFSNNHPSIVDLQEKISSQKRLLAQQIKITSITGSDLLPANNPELAATQQELALELIKLESNSIGLTEQIAYLTEIEKAIKQEASDFPAIEQQLNQLERQLKDSQKTYELLTERLSFLEVTADRNLANVRVISYATVPNAPVSARSLGYMVAIIFGLLCATIVVYLLEIKNRSLKTVAKAKQLFGYNWLGIIPTFEQKRFANSLEAVRDKNNSHKAIAPLVVKDRPGSSVSESYRMLQSNLRFLQGDRQTKTIVITSSVSQEGKSTVAANLAGAMAQVGHKVLLVDADLHTPTQHLIWDTYSDCGLSELLTKNLAPRLITEQVMENLSIIASGKIPPSPATLLDSYKMKDLMYDWAQDYDFVIVDSPSLDRAADAPILGRIADGVLLVVKPDSVDRSQAGFAKETLQRSGINVLGLVFNNINPKLDTSGHYYHSLEGKSDNLPNKQLASEPEELWDSICRIAQEAPKLRLSSVNDPRQLLEAPIDSLESSIDRLQQDLEKLTVFVREQEDELILKRQVVRKLQRKVNLAPIPERFALERELIQEQENKEMLDRTLVGQRRNLESKREILRQYKEMLAVKSE